MSIDSRSLSYFDMVPELLDHENSDQLLQARNRRGPMAIVVRDTYVRQANMLVHEEGQIEDAQIRIDTRALDGTWQCHLANFDIHSRRIVCRSCDCHGFVVLGSSLS